MAGGLTRGVKPPWERRIASVVTKADVAAVSTDVAAVEAKFPITAPDIATGAVEDTKIATGAVTNIKLGTGAVTDTKLATDAVTPIKIQADAVTTVKIANDAVTSPKAATGVVDGDVIQTSTPGVGHSSIVLDGPNNLAKFYSGLAGETPGSIDPTVAAGPVPALAIAPGVTASQPEAPSLKLFTGTTGNSQAVVTTRTLTINPSASALSVGLNGDLDVAANLTAAGPAWAAWTPTVTSATGTLTTVSGSGRWVKLGKTVHFQATITITTAGTGAGGLNFTLPTAPGSMGSSYIGEGRESAATGVALTIMSIGGSNAQILRYDNATIIASGRTCHIKGDYEGA